MVTNCEWNHSCLTAAGKEDQIYKDLRKNLVGMQKAQESCVSIVTTNVFSGFKPFLPWVCLSYPPTYAQVLGHTTPRCRNNSDVMILFMTNLPVPDGPAARRSQSRAHGGGNGHQQSQSLQSQAQKLDAPLKRLRAFPFRDKIIFFQSKKKIKILIKSLVRWKTWKIRFQIAHSRFGPLEYC